MGVGIFVPVSAAILRSAEIVVATNGRFTLGSNAWNLFLRIDARFGLGLPVLIYPTRDYGDPEGLCDPGYVTFRGVYLGRIVSEDGNHPNPVLRPSGSSPGDSLNGGPWTFFWEIGGLVRLGQESKIHVSTLMAERRNTPMRHDFTPYGPMLVTAPFLERHPYGGFWRSARRVSLLR